jgi:hypothetical protein
MLRGIAWCRSLEKSAGHIYLEEHFSVAVCPGVNQAHCVIQSGLIEQMINYPTWSCSRPCLHTSQSFPWCNGFSDRHESLNGALITTCVQVLPQPKLIPARIQGGFSAACYVNGSALTQSKGLLMSLRISWQSDLTKYKRKQLHNIVPYCIEA